MFFKRLKIELSEQIIEYNGGNRWDTLLRIYIMVEHTRSVADKRYIKSLKSALKHIEHKISSLNHKLKLLKERT